MCGSDPSFVDARYLTPVGDRTREERGYCKGTGDTALTEPYRPRPNLLRSSRASDATTLRRTAAVVRGRGDVLDGADLETGRLERTDGGLTTGTRALDEHVDLAHAVLLGAAGSRLGGHLRGERRGLPGALEA